jgi:hypothetical protein
VEAEQPAAAKQETAAEQPVGAAHRNPHPAAEMKTKQEK